MGANVHLRPRRLLGWAHCHAGWGEAAPSPGQTAQRQPPAIAHPISPGAACPLGSESWKPTGESSQARFEVLSFWRLQFSLERHDACLNEMSYGSKSAHAPSPSFLQTQGTSRPLDQKWVAQPEDRSASHFQTHVTPMKECGLPSSADSCV